MIRQTDKTIISAEPEPIEVLLPATAVIVVDMQNGLLKKGGFAEKILGADVSAFEKIIKPCGNLITAAREKGLKIVYLRLAYKADLSDSGGPDSPQWHKEHGLVLVRQHPEMLKDIMVDGTWNTEIIDELEPDPADIVIRKPFFSGFVGTELDIILRTANVKFLIIVGIITNICVGCTVRDAYHLGYFPIVVSDAVASAGPEYAQEAELWNFKYTFAWVTTIQELLRSLSQA
ncbi:unnamed protein product [marine sediment metagenome]|uniref:Isochorismatase-like domain-containing protein n=1 Tax=marine sediment metagenome TaxID=412755 RepID=X0T443_9ZZZZ